MGNNLQIIFSSRPDGLPVEGNFERRVTPVPEPVEGQFLVKINYVSLDPAMRGWMNEGASYVPGMQPGEVFRALAAGVVIRSHHRGFQAGDHVTGAFGAQEYALSDGKGVYKADVSEVPLSWYLGMLGMPGMTAYFGLLDVGRVQQGDTVVVTGAAGIVGAMVGQIAKIKGCRVAGIAGSDEKCQYLRELGFDAVINYKKDNVYAGLRQHCPDKINVLFDNVGGPILDQGLLCLARGARVVICGAISQYNTKDVYGPKNYLALLTTRSEMKGMVVLDFYPRYAEAIRDISSWIREGKLRIREDIREGLTHFPSVLLDLYTGKNFGKLLIKVA